MAKKELCLGTKSGLPELETGAFLPDSVRTGSVRRSRMGKRRALVLIAVHVVIFLHILHWQLAGESVSPVEPSEAMFTLAKGVVNAGAILLLLTLLATLVLGRWFCGWACHLVALQDFCGWLMKKAGIVPRPLKSRALMFVPLLAALVMFFWAPVYNAFIRVERPELSNGLVKSEWWETFPGFWVGLITFVVTGFVMVYVLGAKGFCTYACPYGGLFGVLDRFAPGRIVVNDQCRGCGHCTAVCTSNVQVHQEVREFGRVVDPGCMKCMDCVSVCPENALAFGFAAPAVVPRRRTKASAPRKRTFGLGEEIALGLVFALALLVFRGVPETTIPGRRDLLRNWAQNLYGEVPLLLGLGLAGLTAFLAVLAWRLVRRPDFAFLGAALKSGGRTGVRGRVFLAVAALWFAFVGHSAWLQYHMFQGHRLLERTFDFADAGLSQDRARLDAIDPGLRADIDACDRHFAAAEELALFDDIRIDLHRGRLALLRLDPAEAARRWRRARELAPENALVALDLGRVLALNGDFAGAVRAAADAAALAPPGDVAIAFAASRVRWMSGDYAGAARAAAAAAALAPREHAVREGLQQLAFNLGAMGLYAEAAALLERAAALYPAELPWASALAEARVRLGDPAAAMAALRPHVPEAEAARIVAGFQETPR